MALVLKESQVRKNSAVIREKHGNYTMASYLFNFNVSCLSRGIIALFSLFTTHKITKL